MVDAGLRRQGLRVKFERSPPGFLLGYSLALPTGGIFGRGWGLTFVTGHERARLRSDVSDPSPRESEGWGTGHVWAGIVKACARSRALITGQARRDWSRLGRSWRGSRNSLGGRAFA